MRAGSVIVRTADMRDADVCFYRNVNSSYNTVVLIHGFGCNTSYRLFLEFE